MVTALYRRYRPETFAEMIGQSQVTEPLMTALRTNRVNHAYLFSGPRGCGKTTSARILARCLNCIEGPTDTPCGTCESCVELGRGGQGSLDVVEIDAASHNGVDDARDIRERAIFAPARDRYKIFILDEAHMVTPQGFNALLKIVEEPPEHVKFIFATTEPDKVIGTIRSRTHHYPFRLVPPAQMLDYVQQLCESEGMSVAPGVLPLVVRAGGGSPRDTLSLLDQLIAGSEGDSIEYERAVALLGYTHAALLDEVVDAIGAQDAASAFSAVDRVIQTGQDPRRFVEDLLERLRDLIIVAATSPDAAAAVLRGTPQEELDRMSVQASAYGSAELSRCADIANAALTEMTGATSPRLHLELMIARMLVPASDATDRGALARVERLERRVGVEGASATPAATATQTSGAAAAREAQSAAFREAPSPAASPLSERVAASESARENAAAEEPHARPAASGESTAGATPATTASEASEGAPSAAVAEAAAFAAAAASKKAGSAGTAGAGSSGAATPGEVASAAAAAWATPGVTDDTPAPTIGPVTTQQIRDAWPEILEAVSEASRSAWAVVYTGTVRSLDGDVLSLSFPSENDVQSFRGKPGAKDAASEVLRGAIVELLGIRVKFMAKPAGGAAGGPSGGRPDVGGPGAGGPGAGGPGAPSAGGSGAISASAGPAGGGQPGGGQTGGGRPEPTRPTVPETPVGATRARSGDGGRPAGAPAGTPRASAATTSWATVAIPGATATAVLDRPEAPAASSPSPAPTASATAPAPSTSVTEAPADRPAPRTESAPSVPPPPTDADAPDEDDPPYPDDPGADWAASAAPSDSAAAPAPQQTAPSTPAGRGASPATSNADAASVRTTPTAAPEDQQAKPKTSVGFREPARYGEAVVRELLGAKFIEEQQVAPGSGSASGSGSGWQR
ncbi:hypothetical protein GCM10027568_36070 [Humibacter soli]